MSIAGGLNSTIIRIGTYGPRALTYKRLFLELGIYKKLKGDQGSEAGQRRFWRFRDGTPPTSPNRSQTVAELSPFNREAQDPDLRPRSTEWQGLQPRDSPSTSLSSRGSLDTTMLYQYSDTDSMTHLEPFIEKYGFTAIDEQRHPDMTIPHKSYLGLQEIELLIADLLSMSMECASDYSPLLPPPSQSRLLLPIDQDDAISSSLLLGNVLTNMSSRLPEHCSRPYIEVTIRALDQLSKCSAFAFSRSFVKHFLTMFIKTLHEDGDVKNVSLSYISGALLHLMDWGLPNAELIATCSQLSAPLPLMHPFRIATAVCKADCLSREAQTERHEVLLPYLHKVEEAIFRGVCTDEILTMGTQILNDHHAARGTSKFAHALNALALKAIGCSPRTTVYCLLNLGDYYQRDSRFAEAEMAYCEARIRSSSMLPHGHIYADLARAGLAAIHASTRKSELSTHLADVHDALSSVLGKLGQHHVYTLLLEVRIVDLYIELGQYDNAISMSRKYLRQRSNIKDSHYVHVAISHAKSLATISTPESIRRGYTTTSFPNVLKLRRELILEAAHHIEVLMLLNCHTAALNLVMATIQLQYTGLPCISNNTGHCIKAFIRLVLQIIGKPSLDKPLNILIRLGILWRGLLASRGITPFCHHDVPIQACLKMVYDTAKRKCDYKDTFEPCEKELSTALDAVCFRDSVGYPQRAHIPPEVQDLHERLCMHQNIYVCESEEEDSDGSEEEDTDWTSESEP